MRIAIPTFGTRVSPRFDCAQTVLLVQIEEGSRPETQQLDASGWAPHTRINKLLELGVEVLVCGGIDCWSAQSLQSADVAIFCGVTGEAQEALQAYLRGELLATDSAAVDGESGFARGRRSAAGAAPGMPGRGQGFGRRGGAGRGGGRGGRGGGGGGRGGQGGRGGGRGAG